VGCIFNSVGLIITCEIPCILLINTLEIKKRMLELITPIIINNSSCLAGLCEFLQIIAYFLPMSAFIFIKWY
jgi:hypothetical protein